MGCTSQFYHSSIIASESETILHAHLTPKAKKSKPAAILVVKQKPKKS